MYKFQKICSIKWLYICNEEVLFSELKRNFSIVLFRPRFKLHVIRCGIDKNIISDKCAVFDLTEILVNWSYNVKYWKVNIKC